MRILAVGAHPDDIEILCAGTLLRYKDDGHDVIMAVATNGDQGHFEIMPPELAEIRRKEAAASAAVAGAEFIWMGYHDQFLFHDEPTRLAYIDMVRQARPDVILTHNPDDYAQDHRMVADLVFAASFMAAVPHLETATPHTSAIPPVYYMDSVAGTAFVPTDYVDISSVMDRKIEMLSCHQSQLVWLKEHDNLDVVEMMTTMARFRALSCQGGIQYAEGFRHLDTWGRNPVRRVLP